jgi:hypothetical protein
MVKNALRATSLGYKQYCRHVESYEAHVHESSHVKTPVSTHEAQRRSYMRDMC